MATNAAMPGVAPGSMKIPEEVRQIINSGFGNASRIFYEMDHQTHAVVIEGIRQADGDLEKAHQWEKMETKMVNTQCTAVITLWEEFNRLALEAATQLQQMENSHRLTQQRIEKQYDLMKAGTLDLSGLDWITDEYLHTLASPFYSKLHTIYLSDCVQITGKAIDTILSRCPNLVTLDVTGCGPWQTHTYLVFNSCPQISENSISSIISRCPSLMTLRVGGCANPTDTLLQTIAQNCRNLRGLGLGGCSKFTEEGLKHLTGLSLTGIVLPMAVTPTGFEYILTNHKDLITVNLPQGFPQLSHLKLSLGPKLSEDSLQHIISSCPSVKIISMETCNNVTDQTLRHIVSKCRHLTSLGLSGCSQLTDSGLNCLSSLQALVHVHINHTPNISLQGIQTFLSKKPNLKQLKIDQKSNLTPAQRQQIQRQYPQLKLL